MEKYNITKFTVIFIQMPIDFTHFLIVEIIDMR